ncbi:hypothetical protein BGZ65_009078, partial [Modicella reniformis]
MVPAGSTNFKFAAKFKKCQVGQYVVQWYIKTYHNLNIPNGLRFSVNVTYDRDIFTTHKTEPDTTGSFDFELSSEKLAELDKDHLYDLKLEDLVVIQPHKGEVRVELTLSNCENIQQFKYSGLQVQSVELNPFTEDADQSDPHEDHMKRAAKPNFILHGSRSPAFNIDVHQSGTIRNHPITRLAWSKDGMFLAALALGDDTAYITVWDMKHIGDSSKPPSDTSILHEYCAVAVVKLETPKVLSIGLAISPNGDQVAIYQEPKIGEWAAGTKLADKCEFQFSLFRRKPEDSVIVGAVVPGMSKNTILLDRHTGVPDRILGSFIGYGTFLTETENKDWEMNDVRTALSDNPGDSAGEDGSGGTTAPSSTPTNTLFVTCNGIHIDVFKVGKKWTHIRFIRLTDLLPTLSRRITCKMMMEVVSSNTFMWLEDNGLC